MYIYEYLRMKNMRKGGVGILELNRNVPQLPSFENIMKGPLKQKPHSSHTFSQRVYPQLPFCKVSGLHLG